MIKIPKTVKGLTVEIDGNTTKLSKALEGVSKEGKEISKELSEVNKLLKFNPDDAILMEQKQQLLAKAVENTKNKLETLEKAQEDVNKQFKNGDIGEDQYREFQREIVKTKSQLDHFSGELGKTSGRIEELSYGAEKGATDLKKLDKAADKAEDSIKDVGDTSKASVGKMSALGYAVGEIGDKLSAVSGKIMEFGGNLVDTYKEVGTSLSQFEITAEKNGLAVGTMSNSLEKMVGISGELDSSTEAMNNLMMSGANADQVASAVNQFAGAVTMFPDTLKFESLADSLQESIKTGSMTGQFAELLQRLGYNMDDVNAKFEKAGTESAKMDLALQLMSEQGLAQAGQDFINLNQAMYDNNTATFNLNQAMSDMGEKLMPILNTLIDLAADAINWFNGLDGTWQTIILVLGGLLAAIGPILSIMGPLIIAAGALNVSMLPMIGTILLIVAVIAAVVAAGVLLYKNWDKVKEKLLSVGKSIKDFFKNLPSEMLRIGKDIITGLINGIGSMVGKIKDTVKNVASSITNGVKNFLGISSPSKVMLEFGEYTGEGLAIGLENTIARVKKATENIASNVTVTMDKIIPPKVGAVAQAQTASTGQAEVNNNYNITVNNPQQETSSDSIRRTLLRQSYKMA